MVCLWPQRSGISRHCKTGQVGRIRLSDKQIQLDSSNHWKMKVFSLLRALKDGMNAWSYVGGEIGSKQSEKKERRQITIQLPHGGKEWN